MHWVRNGGLVVYYIFPRWVVCVLVSQTSFKASLIFLFPPLKNNRSITKSTTEQQICTKPSHLIVFTNQAQPIAQFIIGQWRYLRQRSAHSPAKERISSFAD